MCTSFSSFTDTKDWRERCDLWEHTQASSLVIKDLVYKAKAKAMKIFQGQGQNFFLKAKDIKNFQGQGHLIISRPTETITITS